MGQYFQVNGDYNIKVKDGSTITFDPGSTGNVVVTGNLTVSGITTTINTNDLDIEDRIITLNKGESGPGVSLRYSGIEVDRGTGQDRAAFVWDETTDAWIIAAGSDPSDPYTLTSSKLQVKQIITPSNGDLTLIGAGTGVVNVSGTTNYRLQVTDDDDIPNKDYVDYSILNNPTFQIRAPSEDTRVIIADKDVTAGDPGSLDYYSTIISDLSSAESKVSTIVDGIRSLTVYKDRIDVQGMVISSGTISYTSVTNDNIFIETQGTGKLQTNFAIQLDNTVVTPADLGLDSNIVYSKTESTGKTGLFYINSSGTRDELVSKNRSLLFSMLF